MKTKLFQLLGVIGVITLSFSACDTDKCKDVNCGANGQCVEGDCVCNDGYEGATCDTEVRAKFIAQYSASGSVTCPVSGNSTFSNQSLNVGASSTSVSKITMNFAGIFTLTATVDGTSLTIDQTTLGGLVYTGSGSVNGNTLTLTINEEESGVETCVYSINATKQ